MHTFSLDVRPAGYIAENPDGKYGWELHDHGATHPENMGRFDQRHMVVVKGREVFVSAELLDLLDAPARFYCQRSWKLSTGRKLWALTKDALDRMEEAIDYPTRSKREELVAFRNNGIWSFLDTLWIGISHNNPWSSKVQKLCKSARKPLLVAFEDGVTYRIQRAGETFEVTQMGPISQPTISFPRAEFPCLFERSVVVFFE